MIDGYVERKRKETIWSMKIIGKKFHLEDLYIGMKIQDKEQLRDIYDTCKKQEFRCIYDKVHR